MARLWIASVAVLSDNSSSRGAKQLRSIQELV